MITICKACHDNEHICGRPLFWKDPFRGPKLGHPQSDAPTDYNHSIHFGMLGSKADVVSWAVKWRLLV